MSTQYPSMAQATRNHRVTCCAIGALLMSSAVLVACGGGSSSAATATGVATSFSVGAVTGKGSTIVNGVRFDDSGIEHVAIEDANDDNLVSQVNHVSDDVKVGMEVEIEHGTVSCPTSGLTVATCDVTPVAVASKITFGSNSIVGPVAAVSTTGGVSTITLFGTGTPGQTVVTNAATVVSLASQSALAVGQVIEVHGSLDASSKTTTATRIEVKAATAGVFVGNFRIRGLLDVKAGTIGDTPVDLNGAGTTGLDGVLVRAKLDTSSTLKVLTLNSAVVKVADHKGASAELDGNADRMKAESGGDVTITINGAAVRVPATTPLIPATAKLTDLVNGVHVEVEGTVDAISGTLIASKLKFKKAEDDGAQDVELHGTISNYDAKSGTFNLRGETITIDANTFTGSVAGNSKSSLSTLADFEAALAIASNKIEVKGTRAVGGTAVLATMIKLDATSLASLISNNGSIAVGDLVFDGFAIGTSPLLSPQGAAVSGGGLDILVDTTTNASGKTVLRFMQIGPASQAPQPLVVDLAQVGANDQLRNVTFKVTVKNPALHLISVAQSVGPGTTAQGEVTGSVFTYAMLPQPAPGVPLAGQISFVNFSLGSQIGSNSPALPNGSVTSQVFDTAWLLTTAHARGKSPVGSASVDSIELVFTTGAP